MGERTAQKQNKSFFFAKQKVDLEVTKNKNWCTTFTIEGGRNASRSADSAQLFTIEGSQRVRTDKLFNYKK